MAGYVSSRITKDVPSRKGFVKASFDVFPLALSVFTYGLAFGALANNANHFTLWETVAMSMFVFSGAGQFTILSLLQQDATLWAIAISTFLINARYVIYGLSLGRDLDDCRRGHLLWMSHIITDESYSVGTIQAQESKLSVSYFAGAGIIVFLSWILSSVAGYQLGGLIQDPTRYGLDFAFTAAFLGLLIALLKQRSHYLAAALAVIASVVAYQWVGTSGAVFAGAVAAFVVGVKSK
ncbi:AzlC family ABC transporter permease [Paenibacillus sp. ACRRX]|uniref:AzlC family ABC transporter permease n=1 Tax=Paenibacillus TaxID=44249 RepID=UPI000412D198|nr:MULTISPECIES: AzlC family ABC transporter permease [Paenibacillus]MCG7406178.1 AzlC family ABC transporter permease [Paenibacillus sp. ACRRX]MDK8182644.1 AzlC family ABC transporter permease [Paenibacillus sp. UMB4589-SE434]